MKYMFVALLIILISGCKTTQNSGFSYLPQCKMKGSTEYGKISPIRFAPAAVRGQTGKVKARFSILEDGSVGEIEILEATPKRVFDRNTRKTLNQVECRPILKDGKPTKVTGQVIVLNFDHTS